MAPSIPAPPPVHDLRVGCITYNCGSERCKGCSDAEHGWAGLALDQEGSQGRQTLLSEQITHIRCVRSCMSSFRRNRSLPKSTSCMGPLLKEQPCCCTAELLCLTPPLSGCNRRQSSRLCSGRSPSRTPRARCSRRGRRRTRCRAHTGRRSRRPAAWVYALDSCLSKSAVSVWSM